MAGMASSILTRTADELTVVEDVYKTTKAGIVNSFQDIQKTQLELTNQFGFLSQINTGELLQKAKDGMLSLNMESLKDQISSAFSGDYSKAKTLVQDAISGSKSAIDTIKSTTNAVTGLMRQASDVYYTVNGVVNAVKNGNLSDLRGVVDTINNVTGRVGIALSANGAMGGIMTSLVGEAGALGIQDAFGIVAAGVRDAQNITNQAQVIYQMATGSLPAAIARGDLRSVASIADYMGNGAASMLNPTAVKALTKTDKTEYTNAEIIGDDTEGNGQFHEYRDAYQRIDPNWETSSWKPPTGSDSIKDLSALLDSSDEVRKIFTTGGMCSATAEDKAYMALAVLDKPKTVDEEIQSRYPMNPAINSSTVVTTDSNARVIAESERFSVKTNIFSRMDEIGW